MAKLRPQTNIISLYYHHMWECGISIVDQVSCKVPKPKKKKKKKGGKKRKFLFWSPEIMDEAYVPMHSGQFC